MPTRRYKGGWSLIRNREVDEDGYTRFNHYPYQDGGRRRKSRRKSRRAKRWNP